MPVASGPVSASPSDVNTTDPSQPHELMRERQTDGMCCCRVVCHDRGTYQATDAHDERRGQDR